MTIKKPAPSEATLAAARSLREHATQLLLQAQDMDGMAPYIAVHSHRSGDTAYVLWADKKPSDVVAAEMLNLDFEPEIEESIEIDNEEIAALTGLSFTQPAPTGDSDDDSDAPAPGV